MGKLLSEETRIGIQTSLKKITDILTRIQDHPINKIDDLFPANWKKLYPPKITDK